MPPPDVGFTCAAASPTRRIFCFTVSGNGLSGIIPPSNSP